MALKAAAASSAAAAIAAAAAAAAATCVATPRSLPPPAAGAGAGLSSCPSPPAPAALASRLPCSPTVLRAAALTCSVLTAGPGLLRGQRFLAGLVAELAPGLAPAAAASSAAILSSSVPLPVGTASTSKRRTRVPAVGDRPAPCSSGAPGEARTLVGLVRPHPSSLPVLACSVPGCGTAGQARLWPKSV